MQLARLPTTPLQTTQLGGTGLEITRVPLDLPEEAWFDVAMMHKDIGLALDSAREEGLRLPSTRVAEEMLGTACAAGYQHRDIAVLVRMLSDLAAAPLGRPPASVTG
jgi:NAD-binding of NADP-dependent 3-hydroxyisobutyrate dehydrogenase